MPAAWRKPSPVKSVSCIDFHGLERAIRWCGFICALNPEAASRADFTKTLWSLLLSSAHTLLPGSILSRVIPLPRAPLTDSQSLPKPKTHTLFLYLIKNCFQRAGFNWMAKITHTCIWWHDMGHVAWVVRWGNKLYWPWKGWRSEDRPGRSAVWMGN